MYLKTGVVLNFFAGPALSLIMSTENTADRMKSTSSDADSNQDFIDL